MSELKTTVKEVQQVAKEFPLAHSGLRRLFPKAFLAPPKPGDIVGVQGGLKGVVVDHATARVLRERYPTIQPDAIVVICTEGGCLGASYSWDLDRIIRYPK